MGKKNDFKHGENMRNGEITPDYEVCEQDVIDYIQKLDGHQLKVLLCKALYVPTYVDEDAIREALEPVIAAK